MSLKSTMGRVIGDNLIESRLHVYESFLSHAIGLGYEVCSIPRLWHLTQRGRVQPTHKLLVLRHDIDTDISTARSMWQIEKALGIKSSYFFRICTVDVDLMREIEGYGGSAGYHFEELATVAKLKGLKQPEEIMRTLPCMRDLFESNLTKLRIRTGLPLRFVASHGDFVNRRIGIFNWVILDDPPLRERLDIELEAYDEAYMHLVQSRHSDCEYPKFWKPGDPRCAIEAGVGVIQVLVHPREWRANCWVNLVENTRRIYEGLLYSCGIPNRLVARRGSITLVP